MTNKDKKVITPADIKQRTAAIEARDAAARERAANLDLSNQENGGENLIYIEDKLTRIPEEDRDAIIWQARHDIERNGNPSIDAYPHMLLAAEEIMQSRANVIEAIANYERYKNTFRPELDAKLYAPNHQQGMHFDDLTPEQQAAVRVAAQKEIDARYLSDPSSQHHFKNEMQRLVDATQDRIAGDRHALAQAVKEHRDALLEKRGIDTGGFLSRG